MSVPQKDAHASEDHKGSHHAGNPVLDWVASHMGGIITPMGTAAEKGIERFMSLAVNGTFLSIARLYMVVSTPIFLFQFLLHVVHLHP